MGLTEDGAVQQSGRGEKHFRAVSEYSPAGDQGQAIEKLAAGVEAGDRFQTLKGVTGSGKTFTMAKIVEEVQRPTLVISHNKTLAAQLYREFTDFFPDNAVEYFVSYYDYYQPEAYVPSRDLYIEKDASINEEIERLRLSATTALLERRDVLVVATVSSIYGLGSPSSFHQMRMTLSPGSELPMSQLLTDLISLQYERNDAVLERGKFRRRGDVLEIFPAYMKETAYRLEYAWDELESIKAIHPLTGAVQEPLDSLAVYPAKHFVLPEEQIRHALSRIRQELDEQYQLLLSRNKVAEAQRLKTRTEYDLEMLEEMGYCTGIENYSSPLSGRQPGERPAVLLDYFPPGFLTFVDESHVTLSQIGAMYEGDRSRKQNLVDFGFRLPSALDNRPLKYPEFEKIIGETIFVSATPGSREQEKSARMVEQLIRPTGLLDPEIDIRPTEGQIEDLYAEIRKRTEKEERTLVTTLTKKMAEDMTDYLLGLGLKVRYLHSEIDTFERVEILRDLRSGKFDVLIGVNLLREGLDLPEVSLIAIMDADKIGFLRSATALIQTIDPAARKEKGYIFMYADRESPAMAEAVGETRRRRQRQEEYNRKHGITPKTVRKNIQDILQRKKKEERQAEGENVSVLKARYNLLDPKQKKELLKALEKEMLEHAKNLEFEKAAYLRDEIEKIRKGESE